MLMNTSAVIVVACIMTVIALYISFTYLRVSAESATTTILQTAGTGGTGFANVTSLAVNLTQELNNSARNGFSLNSTAFYAASASQCEKHLINFCNNNVPDQYICINRNYSESVWLQYGMVYHNRSEACPLYLLDGNISCGLSDNYCVVYFTLRVNDS